MVLLALERQSNGGHSPTKALDLRLACPAPYYRNPRLSAFGMQTRYRLKYYPTGDRVNGPASFGCRLDLGVLVRSGQPKRSGSVDRRVRSPTRTCDE